MKIQDTAYVLHRRPYRETSFLVDFFTRQHGVVTAVCRGIRQSKHVLRLDCFSPFWIEYGHRHNLATLYQWELLESKLNPLIGIKLYCGLYLNELLVKLLGHHDSYPEVFDRYQQTLSQLSQKKQCEEVLRLFEFYLLKETGYEIPLTKEASTAQPIMKEKYYYYRPGVGFILISADGVSSRFSVFDGSTIMAIAQGDFSMPGALRDAKRLIRITLAALLEKKEPLKSRALFVR